MYLDKNVQLYCQIITFSTADVLAIIICHTIKMNINDMEVFQEGTGNLNNKIVLSFLL